MIGHGRRMRRILLVDPNLYAYGGGLAVLVHAIQALKDHFDVSFAAWRPPEFDGANLKFGTSVQRSDVSFCSVPYAAKLTGNMLNAIDPSPYSVQRWAVLMRVARSISRDFDVVVSCNGEIDVGRPCIQYVHYPYLGEVRCDEHDRENTPWRIRPWRHISKFSFVRSALNLTLTNSHWTSEVMTRFYPEASRVSTVYPPVPLPSDTPSTTWEERDNDFVCIGRIYEDKRLEFIIEVVRQLRFHRPDIRLHIVGTPTPFEPGGKEYYQRIVEIVRANPHWLFLHESVSRSELIELLSRHRYGIHARVDEHFGIAVAEMVRMGCIVFAHRSGGQTEILDDMRLVYDSLEDAIEKILFIMYTPRQQLELNTHLRKQAQLFSAGRFMEEMRNHVEDFLRG